MKLIGKMPESEEIKELYPISPKDMEFRKKRVQDIKSVLSGSSDKMLVIIGPCSCDSIAAMDEYLKRLSLVREKIKNKILIVPRIYTSKPRSLGTGYMGMLESPDPESDPNLIKGIEEARKVHAMALKNHHLPGADEMLYPANYAYFDDLLAYVSLGARSAEDQEHRKLASGLDVAVGIKNPIDGNLRRLMESIYAVNHPQFLSYRGHIYKTEGNPYAGAILRGYVDKDNGDLPNYQKESIMEICRLAQEMKMRTPSVIIDCNHSNSGKNHHRQKEIIERVMEYREADRKIKNVVRGFMVESYLEEGNADRPCSGEGISLTDPCIGWDDTEKLLINLARYL